MNKQELNKFIDKISPTGPGGIEKIKRVLKAVLDKGGEEGITEEELLEALNTKQDTIQDLSEIRSGASLGATAYQKPSAGIPSTDMTSAVQNSLELAVGSLQKTAQTLTSAEKAQVWNNLGIKEGVSKVVSTLPTTEIDENIVYLVPTANAGEFTEYKYNGSSWDNLGTFTVPAPTVVNDLETGGSTSALSAEMGKVLDGKVSQLGQKVTGNIVKDVTWSNGYVQASTGVVKSSTASRFSQPFLLKAGEKVTVGTQNSNIGIICSTNADSVAVGNTVTVIKATSSLGQFETYEYTAEADIKIVVCVLASNYDLSFHDTDNLTDKIGNAATQKEVDELQQDVNLIGEKEYNNGEVVFTSKSIEAREKLAYSLNAQSGKIGCLRFFDSNDNTLLTIGKASISGNVYNFYGVLTVPDGFAYAKVICSSDITVPLVLRGASYLRQRISGVYSLPTGNYKNMRLVFSQLDVNEGDTIEYSISNEAEKTAFIDVLDSNGTRIMYVGIGSTSPAKTVSGSFVIPSSFNVAIMRTSGTSGTINYLRSSRTLDYIARKQTEDGIIIDDNTSKLGFIGLRRGHLTGSSTFVILSPELKNNDMSYRMVFSNIISDRNIVVMITNSPSGSNFRSIGTIPAGTTDFVLDFQVRRQDIDATYLRFYFGSGTEISFDFVLMYDYAASIVASDNAVQRIEMSLNNRLASPIFESNESWNEKYPNNQIAQEAALSKGMVVQDNFGYRVPSLAITNEKTILVSGMHMKDAGGDYGDFSIHIARKTINDNDFTARVIVPVERGTYGNTQNTQFLVDRLGTSGVVGRIYFFFTTTKLNAVVWEQTTASVEPWYIYSDDDGITWSDMVSLKSLQDVSKYQLLYTGVGKGIQMQDGTLVTTMMAMKLADASGDISEGGYTYANRTSAGILLILKPGGDWEVSEPITVEGVPTIDEGAVVEKGSDEVYFVGRCNVNFQPGILAVHHFFCFNISTGTYYYVPNTFKANYNDQLGLDVVTLNGTKIYLMSFPDTNVSNRAKLTLWASLDFLTWIRVYRIKTPATAGYSCLDHYDGMYGVAYEGSNTSIEFQDISVLTGLVSNSVTFIDNYTVEDRLQALFNHLAGIDEPLIR